MKVDMMFREARQDEQKARIRRLLALRAMVASGMTQRQIGEAVGISQPAVSQQLKAAAEIGDLPPEVVITAGGPVLKAIAHERGFSRLAVFGSVARGESTPTSDIDFLVEARKGTTMFDLVRLQDVFQQVLSREVDVVSWGGLKPRIDDDIRREAVLL